MNWILRQIFERVTGRTSTVLRVVFANRTVWQVLQGEPDVSIAFHTMAAECRTVLLGYVWFFEAYLDGDVAIEGERAVGRLMRMAFAGAYHYRANPLLLAKRRYLEWCNNNQDFARAKANAIHHYGLPFEFFRLMLGDAVSMRRVTGPMA
jgi:cyclopropane-fatty-acyl-phospholipid synthase